VRGLQRQIGPGLSVIIVAVLGALAVRAQKPIAEWRYYGGDKAFTRYSPLAQITRDNVKSLKVAWRRPAVDSSLTQAFPDLRVSAYLKATPIVIDGVLYTPNAQGLITAFDGATGATKWEQEPFARTPDEVAGQATRGVDIWGRGNDMRIVAVRGEYLYVLDAQTGKLLRDFGDRGRVNLHRNEPYAARFNDTSGPIVVGDVAVIGGQGGGGGDTSSTMREAAPEDIRGYDVRTGELRWTFHVVPKQGEFGHESWGNESWKFAGNLAAWCPLSADEELGYVYIPLTAPTASYFGGYRPGDNLYADTVVALDAKTGKRAWHFQTIHHDLWEYDLIGPPILGDITVNGKRIRAVIQAGKNGFLYVLDRVTGQPVWPIEERPVPQSTVPGEHTSPTQPFPTKPPAFDRQGLTDDDLIDFTPALKAESRELIKPYVFGPLYTPPSLASAEPGAKKGTIAIPGNWGAGNWHTGAFDPDTGIYYAVSLYTMVVYDLVKPTDSRSTMEYVLKTQGGRLPGGVIDVQGLPLTKPPYGRITAFDLNRGEQIWMAANGDGPRNHPLLKDLHLPPLGIPNRPAPLVTKTLLFIGEGSDAILGVRQESWAWGKKFRAYDKATGKVIWEMELPSGTTGGPMTYMAKGKQYILVPVGSKDHAAEFVALALP
jgi:quinoprotein glucose dehydrogenase